MSPVSDIKVHAANEKAQDALMRGPIFFLLGGRRDFFAFFSFLFPMFPSCSQVVPQQHLSFIPYSLHKVQLPMPMYKKLKRWAIGEAHLFLFETWGPKMCFYWGVPNVPKNIGDSSINMAPSVNK
jgi:hypothetical protein